MLHKIFILNIVILILLQSQINGQSNSGFKVIPLGVKGGLDESNLSAYLVAANGSDQYICLDAGTIYKGLELAAANKLFNSLNPSSIQQQQIKGYFISHAHLDHTAGLIMNSPNDNAKNLYGLASVLDVFKKNYFTWSAWANFGNEGEAPILKKYSYQTLTPKLEIPIDNNGRQIDPTYLVHTIISTIKDSLYSYYKSTTTYNPTYNRYKMNKEMDKQFAPIIQYHLAQLRNLQITTFNKKLITSSNIYYYLCQCNDIKNIKTLIQFFASNPINEMQSRTSMCFAIMNTLIS